jgi:plastocyanin
MTHVTKRMPRLMLASALPVVAMLLASGSGHSGRSATTAITSSRVTATETEYKIVLSRASLKPGTYSFVAVNKGKIAHSLAVNGPGVAHKRITGTIPPGSSKTLTITLRKGSYDVYCPVDGHKALGMDRKVSVS